MPPPKKNKRPSRGPKKTFHRRGPPKGSREQAGPSSRFKGKPEERSPAHEHDRVKISQETLDAAAKETLILLNDMRAQAAQLKVSQHAQQVNAMPNLDPWQREVLDALVQGKNVVVDAPTTAGKTRAVEVFFRLHIGQPQFRAAYTAPVKSLSNDKLREFSDMFGAENVGIATGDIKENLGAPIVVTTLETYRNSLLGVEPDLGRRLVIFDEYHFMQDYSRGSAWEEALVLTPPDCQLLLLSASVGNAEDFSSWLNTIHERETLLVRTLTRPVPLRDLIYIRGRWLDSKTLGEGVFKKVLLDKEFKPLPPPVLAPRIASARALGLTPTIIYAGKRLSCEIVAAELAKVAQNIEGPRQQELNAVMNGLREELKLGDYGIHFF